MATLLVVDDEPGILKLITYVLGSEHAIITAESGIEALAIFESYHDKIDLIISDVMMPHMSGLEFVARLEKLYSRRVPVLFITGASDYPIDAGRTVLRKPFSLNVLEDMVRQLLQAVN